MGRPTGAGGDRVRPNTTIDTHIAWNLSKTGLLGDSEIYVDVENLFDRDPPFCGSAPGYDSLRCQPAGQCDQRRASAQRSEADPHAAAFAFGRGRHFFPIQEQSIGRHDREEAFPGARDGRFRARHGDASPRPQIQATKEDILFYTSDWTGERFPDGRPKVPDAILKRLLDVNTEEAWGILRQAGYNNQFEGGFQMVHNDRPFVGRALTVQYLPMRPDNEQGDQRFGREGEAQRRA